MRGGEYREMETAVTGFLEECRARQAKLEETRGTVSAVSPAVEPATPKLQEKLRALGYVQ